ncbi:hypothetical protein HNR65_003171 [Desulfosalsimonas propionicica]|uniref:Uncharacterized protein n=1 Tax=Desulfosalsimonas propionicica TaxID=332175 RepID=A0A7W0HM91_9BACT|nr:BrxA family protein [Desulfosalsimonas propionicica]MBA2882816.1 hypothetical protein [Desulfosalsimonas propionicica]
MTEKSETQRPSTPVYTSRLQKGGALIEDMRAIVRNWSDEQTAHHLIQTLIKDNILGKETKTRSTDLYRRAFSHRFIKGDPPNAWQIIRPLEDNELAIEIIKPIYYWITARSDPLMYDFVTDEIYSRSKGYSLDVKIDETAQWIKSSLEQNHQQVWTETVTLKVARGLLAALRDFGILEGATKKKIAPIYLPLESFAYIAYALNSLGFHGGRLTNHKDWQLFLFSPTVAERMFLEAHQNGLLHYEAAGNIYRIEFPANSYKEMTDVITARSFG